jgi:peptide methionine sulfoxide reductase MsrA
MPFPLRRRSLAQTQPFCLDDEAMDTDKGGPYKPAIFYDGESERRVAEESKSSIQAAHPTWGPIVVPLLPIDKFWPAEDYHQDYYIKSEEWYR